MRHKSWFCTPGSSYLVVVERSSFWSSSSEMLLSSESEVFSGCSPDSSVADWEWRKMTLKQLHNPNTQLSLHKCLWYCENILIVCAVYGSAPWQNIHRAWTWLAEPCEAFCWRSIHHCCRLTSSPPHQPTPQWQHQMTKTCPHSLLSFSFIEFFLYITYLRCFHNQTGWGFVKNMVPPVKTELLTFLMAHLKTNDQI